MFLDIVVAEVLCIYSKRGKTMHFEKTCPQKIRILVSFHYSYMLILLHVFSSHRQRSHPPQTARTGLQGGCKLCGPHPKMRRRRWGSSTQRQVRTSRLLLSTVLPGITLNNRNAGRGSSLSSLNTDIPHTDCFCG